MPPGPKRRLFGGYGGRLKNDPLAFMADCQRRYGDVVCFRFRFGYRFFLLTHPDLNEEVLLSKNRCFKKAFGTAASRVTLGNSLLTSYGDIWLRQRRLAQPAFHRDRFPGYLDGMAACVEESLARWRPGETRDVFEEMKRVALEGLARCLFNTDLQEGLGEFAAGVEVLLDGCLRWSKRPTRRRFRLFQSAEQARDAQALAHLDEIAYRMIARRRTEGEDRGDLLSALLAARDEESGRPLTDLEARDATVTILSAGSETTAIAALWSWYLLSRHPRVEALLADEVASVLRGRLPTASDLPRLRYAEMVFLESMRLYPPAYQIGREAVADCEIGGYPVRARDTIWLSPWLLHRDPRYFERPEEFDPARWENGLAARLPKFAYFPFGGGPRTCIGDKLAMREGVLILAMIAQRFRFSPMRGGEIGVVPAFVLRPGPGTETVLSKR